MPRPRKKVLKGNTGWVIQTQWLQVERIASAKAYVAVVVNQQKANEWIAVGVVSPGENVVEIFDNHAHKIIGTTYKTANAAKKAAEAWLKKYVREIKGPKGKKALSDKCACEEIGVGAYANGVTYKKVPKKDQCGAKDDRGRPCVRDKAHTPDGPGVGLHVTADGRGFHGGPSALSDLRKAVANKSKRDMDAALADPTTY